MITFVVTITVNNIIIINNNFTIFVTINLFFYFINNKKLFSFDYLYIVYIYFNL